MVLMTLSDGTVTSAHVSQREASAARELPEGYGHLEFWRVGLSASGDG